MSRLKTLSDLRRRRTVLALRSAGPGDAPGMPEWGGLPIRKKLLALGVRDMVRISDAREIGRPHARGSVRPAHPSPSSTEGPSR
jgi:dihydroxyacid dehydratase/phosphogluconate dehydratase